MLGLEDLRGHLNQHSHFTDDKIEAQRSKMTLQISEHSFLVVSSIQRFLKSKYFGPLFLRLCKEREEM